MSNDELPRDAELSALYREAADAVPPTALDRRILAAAQAAVTVKPVELRSRPWWLRLAAPMGVFATLVLTVTVVMLAEHEQKDLLPHGEEAPAAAPVPLRKAAPQGQIMEKEPAAPPAAPVAKAPAALPADRAVMAPELRRQRSEAEAMAEPERRESKPAAPAMAPGAGAIGGLLAAPVPAGTDSAKKSARDEAPAASSPAPAVRLQVQPPPAESKAEVPPPAATMAPAPAPMQERARPAAKSKSQASSADQALRSPEAWLADIRRLRADGRDAEAREQLDLFRKTYPGYPLPADLR